MKQYPVFHGLFVFSFFGLLAGHISNDMLAGVLTKISPQALPTFDRWLNELLVDPLGADLSVFMVLAVGTVFAGWAFSTSASTARIRQQVRYSTW